MEALPLVYSIKSDGMVILYRGHVSIANFGSHGRYMPTGKNTPQYFCFQEAFECIRSVCLEEGDEYIQGLSLVAHDIIEEYKQRFQHQTDPDGWVKIPDNAVLYTRIFH